MSTVNIVVKLQHEAIHCWKGVAEHADTLAKEQYLQYPHRHTFCITCKKAVSHCDRDVEIIDFKRQIAQWLQPQWDLQETSCEYLALQLLKQFDLVYCEVLEDNENGAEVFA